MPIKSSGSLGANEIQTEFGDTGDFVINEYYGAAPGLPTSGQIAWSDFYGKSSAGSQKTLTNQLLFRLSIRHDRYVDIAFDVRNMYGVIWDANPSGINVPTAATTSGGGSFLNVNYPNGIEPLGDAVSTASISVNMNGTSSRSPFSVIQNPSSGNSWTAIFRCDDGGPPGAALSSIQGNINVTPLSSSFVTPRPRFDRTMAGAYSEADSTIFEQYLIPPTGCTFLSASASFPDATTGGLPHALSVQYTNFSSVMNGGVTIGVRNNVAGTNEYSFGRWTYDIRGRVGSNVMASRLRVTGTIRYRSTNYSYTNFLYIHYLQAYAFVPDTGGGG